MINPIAVAIAVPVYVTTIFINEMTPLTTLPTIVNIDVIKGINSETVEMIFFNTEIIGGPTTVRIFCA